LALDSLQHFASKKLAHLDSQLLSRKLVVTDRIGPASAVRSSGSLLSFACNDYLGLSQHPDVIEASNEATSRLGVGAGASRHVSGNHSLYSALEKQLATLKSTEDAVVFGSGYLANIGIIPVLAGPADLILLDEASHACLYGGAKLTGSRVVSFAHNNVDAASEILARMRRDYRHCLVLTEGVFSMDGDRAPIADLLALADKHDAWLMTDDAHGLGVVGQGRGSNVKNGKALPVPLQMGTLSKAVGAYGAYLCASRAVINLIRNRARSLIYSTALPPGTVAAASKALEIIATDQELVQRPTERAKLYTSRLGLPEAESPIVPIILHSPERVLDAGSALEKSGYLVGAIRPPTVADGTARLRCTFSAAHRVSDIEAFAEATAKTLANL
jgi:8-amino-7-oxononanoate synthase